MINTTSTRNSWRVTGPPENFLTAVQRSYWAFNERYEQLWRDQLATGDVFYFHSTAKSGYGTYTSAIIGLAIVGPTKVAKSGHWWIQEIENDELLWPFAIQLTDIVLLDDVDKHVDFMTPVEDKQHNEIRAECRHLAASGVPISRLNEWATQSNPQAPQFPVNGSVSHFNEVYESLLADVFAERGVPYQASDGLDDAVETLFNEVIDAGVTGQSREALLEQARQHSNNKPAHSYTQRPVKQRIESAIQKRRVASLEDYTCQVCGFRCCYPKRDGQTGWIIDVDHIRDKAAGGDENIDNLWVLCPTCHRKKTAGVIEIDPATRQVSDHGKPIFIRNRHLSWLPINE